MNVERRIRYEREQRSKRYVEVERRHVLENPIYYRRKAFDEERREEK